MSQTSDHRVTRRPCLFRAASAAMQVPYYPQANAPTPPVSLDPGASPGTRHRQYRARREPRLQQAPCRRRQARRHDDVRRRSSGAGSRQLRQQRRCDGTQGRRPSPCAGRFPSSTSSARATRSGISAGSTSTIRWQWPKVWSYNPQITNPHWIYPGDLRTAVAARRVRPNSPTRKEPEQAPELHPVANLPAPQRNLQVGLKQTAFVEKANLDKSIEIDGAVDEKTLLSDNGSIPVYLSYPAGKPPQVGQKYSIYQPDNSVKANGKEVGSYVRILGTVEVVSVKQDKRARGVISEASQEIERGDKVGPLVKQYKTVPPVGAEGGCTGQRSSRGFRTRRSSGRGSRDLHRPRRGFRDRSRQPDVHRAAW